MRQRPRSPGCFLALAVATTAACADPVDTSRLPLPPPPAGLTQVARENVGPGLPPCLSRPAQFDPTCGVVLPADAGLRLVRECDWHAGQVAPSLWTPTEFDIAGLETNLAPAVRIAFPRRSATSAEPWAGDFFRQYVGILVGGRRLVYVNGFHSVPFKAGFAQGGEVDWRTQPVRSCGRGTLAFQADYDPATGLVVRIEFGGS